MLLNLLKEIRTTFVLFDSSVSFTRSVNGFAFHGHLIKALIHCCLCRWNNDTHQLDGDAMPVNWSD